MIFKLLTFCVHGVKSRHTLTLSASLQFKATLPKMALASIGNTSPNCVNETLECENRCLFHPIFIASITSPVITYFTLQ